MSSNVTAYPWHALESVQRSSMRRAARARRQVQALIDLPRLGQALSELCECETSIVVRRVGSDRPRRRPLTTLGFELGNPDTPCALSLEPEFAASVLARVLRRSITLASGATLDATLAGALSAVVLETARRSGARGSLQVIDPTDALARAQDVFIDATVLLEDTAYQVLVALSLAAFCDEPSAALSTLADLEIALPVVIGQSLAERSALADLVPGNAWFPGAGMWLGADGTGQIALAAPGHDAGISGALSRDGKIVLRGESVPLLPDPGETMTDHEKPEQAKLAENVLDSPVVVRVEMGAVSMTAREWSELGPGDVIGTGRRIAEPVILRVAGREVARGELVNLEGEIGVRIRELVRS